MTGPDGGPAAVDPAALLRLAVSVAEEAGALVREGRDSADLDVEVKSSPTDAVTAMDKAAERLIGERLRSARPGDGILGEEGALDAGTTGVRWVVDPIDGTVNYLYRIPDYSVSIAAEVSGVVECGVVHQPVTGATYTAVRGGGAFRDGVKLAGSRVTQLSQALVGTGFGYDVAMRERQARVLLGLLGNVRDIRRFGSAALDLCHVAEGRFDCYYEAGLNAWDLAAGGLICAEAGVTVGGLRGAGAGQQLVVAAPPGLWPAFHDLLVGLDADTVLHG